MIGSRHAAVLDEPHDVIEPVADFKLVKTKGRSPHIRRACRFITSSEAADHRRQVDLVDDEQIRFGDAGPSLRGIPSPAATSMT
jgi:hypothetical protein